MASIYEKNVDYPSGLVPFTRGVIPAANIIVIGGAKIGYIQNIDETQERPVTEQYEVGSIGPVDMLPGQPKYSFTLSHVKVYTQSMLKVVMALGYSGGTDVNGAIQGQLSGDNKDVKVFSLITHNILPFEIQVLELNYGVDSEGDPIDFNLDIDNKKAIITKYKDCWITNYTKPIAQGTVNVVETMSISARKIDMGQRQ